MQRTEPSSLPSSLIALFALLLVVNAAPLRAAAAPAMPQPIEFEEETLPNGLRVIYAPLHQAPVVHLRVLYHVGSKDERPDRQGFAHLFEHMMFRGSAHVKPEQHMRLVGTVGGNSNAFTSFDQTVYVNTVPAEHLEMVMYLEADRMASFKVDENIYKTERKVVAEEWRIRQNRPYGTLFENFLKNSFTASTYRWTPIGVMEHLQAAGVAELQDFFNTYYLPNNAMLVIAGDIDVPKTKELARKYYGWIPAGPKVERKLPAEPEQTEARRVEMPDRVPLPAVMIGYHLPDYKSDDQYALGLLGSILSGGRSARLDGELVYGAKPMAVEVSAGPTQLEEAGVFTVRATIMQGRDPAAVEKALVDAVALVVEKGVTAEELEKAKTNTRVGLIRGRQTAVDLAGQLGEEALFGGDANRANEALAKVQAVTAADVQAVAKRYLQPQRATTLNVKPDPTGAASKVAAARKAPDAPAVAQREAKPRDVTFPADWPASPTVGAPGASAVFKKGTESASGPAKVVVMPDSRLPLVTWSLTMRRGSHSDPAGKEGLASLTGEMLRRGAGGMTFEQLNQELESRGITVEVSDGGDYTRLAGSCTTDQLDYAIRRTRDVLRVPDFPQEQFDKLKEQTVNQLALTREDPRSVAGTDLTAALYGDSPLGRYATPESVAAVTLDDVKRFYRTHLTPDGAILIVAGDVTEERGRKVAHELLEPWQVDAAKPRKPDYALPPAPAKRRIILVDRAGGKQATVRMGIRAYDVRSDEKYAGAVASQILTSGIDSRLGKYVRAEKGLAYGVTGVFQPGRQAGSFVGATDTAVESAGAAVEAMWKVFDDMRREDVTEKELSEAQMRVAGSMVMGMQTIQQQAGYRVDGILNDYPIDYYDTYPQKIAQVTRQQIRDVMNKYVRDGEMVIVVVAPADAVKAQLETLGEVEVVPMPAKREGAKPSERELLKKKAA
jgi:zinc protease